MNKVFTKLALTLSVMALVFAFSACNNDKENAQRFKDAAMSLDKTTHTLTDRYDYWPECGIRTTGSHLSSLISLAELEAMLPCPLYVSGPHQDGQWDLDNVAGFGYYNPKAVQYLADLAKKVVADKKFVETSKPLVDQYLYDKMLIMMVLHDALYDEGLPELMGTNSSVKETREEIFNELIENNGSCYDIACRWQGSLLIDVDSWTGNGSNEHFLYFWARRWKDGTIDQFYNGLRTIFLAYHPEYEYEFNLENYIWESEEYWDGDWEEFGEETGYNCYLEADEPVTDGERIKENDAVEMIRKAITNLDNTSYAFADGYDYWPDCGIRSTGGHLFSLISLKALNRMLPCELYVSGPHYYNRWNLNHPYEFGHYNPEAVSYLGQLAKKVVADKKFVETTKPLVDKYLKRQMLIMKGLYDGLKDKSICENDRAVLNDIVANQGHAYKTFASTFLYDMQDLEDGSYVYSNTGEMFLYFWGRRNVDGTMEQFHDILETVYNAYYSE